MFLSYHHDALPQAGVLQGPSPVEYNTSDPISVFIIQAGLILVTCHVLYWPLSKMRQPHVMAELASGIILGPSVLGHIPGFQAFIFPTESLSGLSLTANLGLVLYFFLVGMEMDVNYLVVNWRLASIVAVVGLATPFVAGCGLAWGLYYTFRDDPELAPVEFSTYMLFIGVAIAITAFPVLCRILSELRLMRTSVGVVTLSAGILNDLVGWTLLALCLALANAGSRLSPLWILLTCAGFLVFLVCCVRPALLWLLRRIDSLQKGPSQMIFSLTVLLALAAAFSTGVIGVHPILGAFWVGLLIPREGQFNAKVIEKLEDIVRAVLLPLYFALSGLRTDVGLFNSGRAWAYVLATTIIAFATKVFSAAVAARLSGFVWRESLTIGALMSCKGHVELVALNIGLQAGILSPTTFTIFVIMAVMTTFCTVPLVSWLYSPAMQEKLELWRRGATDRNIDSPSTLACGSAIQAAEPQSHNGSP